MKLSRRLALVLIRLHPPAWRRRYADEVSALVEQSPGTFQSVIDLARSVVGEWTRAMWRSAVIEPGQWPHPGRVAGLWLMTVFAFYVGVWTAQVAEAVYYAGVLVSYAMTGKAIEVLSFQADGFRLARPALSPSIVLDVFAGMYLWFGMPATPVIVAGRVSRLGRRFPLTTRFAVVTAFSALPIWLLGLPAMGGTLLGGWVLASGFFPRRPAAGPAATSTPVVHT